MPQGHGNTTMQVRRLRRGRSYAVELPPMSGVPMTREEAGERLRKLVARYGLHWTRATSAAYLELAAINTVLDEAGRREALGMNDDHNGRDKVQ